MNRKQEIFNRLNRRFGPDTAPVQVWPAIVKKIDGLNCTVDLLGTGLTDVEDISLRANDEMQEGVLIVPRVGSLVYVSALQNVVDNLFVCMVSEVDRVEVIIDKMNVAIQKDSLIVQYKEVSLSVADTVEVKNDKVALTLKSTSATLKQEQTVVELKGGKVSIKNAGTSLKDLFDDLATLLQAFQVTCAAPGSPSAPFPASVAQVIQLKTKATLLLS